MRRLLIIAPHFAPVNAPDGQRIRLLLPDLVALGWHCTILCADPDDCSAPVDRELNETLPNFGCEIFRLKARPVRWGIRNIGIRLIPALRKKFRELSAKEPFDLAYFSTTQFACLKLGPEWKKYHQLPFVVDLQDPWLSDFYEKPNAPSPPGGWKYRFARWSAQINEPRVLKACAHVVSVSPDYLATLRQRYGWFTEDRGSVIPFGWSCNDQQVARRQGLALEPMPVIRYIGRVGDDMEHLLNDLFSCIRVWSDRSRNHAHRLRWEFIGTSYAQTAGGGVVRRCAARFELDHAVTEEPQRVGYLHALRTSQQAWANLVLGSDDTGYSPSKTWPVLATGRPWLAWFSKDSVIARQMPRPRAHDFLRVDSVSSEGFEHWLTQLVTARPADAAPPSEIELFSSRRLAQLHSDLFEKILRETTQP